MRIRVQTAFLVAAVILSTPVGAAELSPNLAEWPTGDVWPSEAAPQRGAPTADQRPIPATPPQEQRARPNASNLAPAQYKFDIPTEFRLNITLTIRRNDKPPERHGRRSGTTRTGGSRHASLHHPR
jgi:hypothetical protein